MSLRNRLKSKNRLPNASNESTRLKNRVDNLQGIVEEVFTHPDFQKTKFLGICYSTHSTAKKFIGSYKDKAEEKAKYKPKEVIIDAYGNVKEVTKEGQYYMCYVRLLEKDSLDHDPEGQTKYSDEYWNKIKMQRQILFPKKNNIWGKNLPPHRSVWWINLTNGSILNDDDGTRGLAETLVAAGPDAETLIRNYALEGVARIDITIVNAGYTGDEYQVGSGFQYPRCVNGVITWEAKPADPANSWLVETEIEADRTDNKADITAAKAAMDAQVLANGGPLTLEQADKLMPWFDWKTYQKSVISLESSVHQYGEENSEGYIGAYQMGMAALYDTGALPLTKDSTEYKAAMKHGWFSADLEKYPENKGKNKAAADQAFLDADWESLRGKGLYKDETLDAMILAQSQGDAAAMKDAWKLDTEAQDKILVKYTLDRAAAHSKKQSEGKYYVDPAMPSQMHGALMYGHLAGMGNWKKFFNHNKVKKDGYKTEGDKYYAAGANNYLKANNPCELPLGTGN